MFETKPRLLVVFCSALCYYIEINFFFVNMGKYIIIKQHLKVLFCFLQM